MELLKLVGWSFLFMYVTWFFYLAVMNLIKAKKDGKLKPQAAVFAYPVAVVGILLDFALNVTVGTVLFVEIPKHWLLTQRLEEHCAKQTWRGAISRWICENLLDAFDPSGLHCKCDKDETK